MNYKLIKTYPGSPDLGYISKPRLSQLDKHYWCFWFSPSNYPDHWEPIPELNYFKDFKYIKFLKNLDYGKADEIANIKDIHFDNYSNNFWLTYNILSKETIGGFRIIGYNPTELGGYKENKDFIFLTESDLKEHLLIIPITMKEMLDNKLVNPKYLDQVIHYLKSKIV